jgi:peptidoglycan DL-endopeptidase CwlO
VQADDDRMSALSERYDFAELQLTKLDVALSGSRAQVAQARAHLQRQRIALRSQAISNYMNADLGAVGDSFFAPPSTQQLVAEEYSNVSAANTSELITRLHHTENVLQAQEQHIHADREVARDELAQASAARRIATATLVAQRKLLAGVQGRLAMLANELAAFHADLASFFSGKPMPPAPNGEGAIAVSAAETQLGVPYVWGGATPEVGFDCSGLTMWAWAQAGVGLPHFAAYQYDDTVHVPLSDLQPGDLLFYDEGGAIGHVTMYIGFGEVIQAPHTGTDVQITPVWLSGLVGAGRPGL